MKSEFYSTYYGITIDATQWIMYIKNAVNINKLSTLTASNILGNLIYRNCFTHSFVPTTRYIVVYKYIYNFSLYFFFHILFFINTKFSKQEGVP